MLDKLHTAGIFFLKEIGCPSLTLLSGQGGLSANTIGLSDSLDVICWNDYLAILNSSHVRLTDSKDTLVWNLSKNGKYTPKEGYVHLLHDRFGLDLSWWWKVLWKLKCPLKSIFFVGFSFLIRHSLGMSWLEEVLKDLVDVICVNWMLSLIFI